MKDYKECISWNEITDKMLKLIVFKIACDLGYRVFVKECEDGNVYKIVKTTKG